MGPIRPMWLFHTLATASTSHQEYLKAHARLTLHGFRLMTKNVTLNLAAGHIVVGRYLSRRLRFH
jgi:hypothetical protein